VAVVSTFVVEASRPSARPTRITGRQQPDLVRLPIDGEWRVTPVDRGRSPRGLGVRTGTTSRRSTGPELTLGVVRQIRPGSFDTIPVHGTFEVDGPFVILRDQGETLLFRWSLSGSQLRLTLVDDSRKPSGERADRLIWTTRPWVRVG
jgi:hypothetical protein